MHMSRWSRSIDVTQPPSASFRVVVARLTGGKRDFLSRSQITHCRITTYCDAAVIGQARQILGYHCDGCRTGHPAAGERIPPISNKGGSARCPELAG